MGLNLRPPWPGKILVSPQHVADFLQPHTPTPHPSFCSIAQGTQVLRGRPPLKLLEACVAAMARGGLRHFWWQAAEPSWQRRVSRAARGDLRPRKAVAGCSVLGVFWVVAIGSIRPEN